MKRVYSIIVSVILLLCVTSIALADNLDLAKDYYSHNLIDKAKEIFINILNDTKATDAAKAESLYWLGEISFSEGRYSIALSDWGKLIKKYPRTSQAKEISDRLNQLQEVISKNSEDNISSVVAKSYLKNGDFWSEGAANIFKIDASWMPSIELAVEWYDRTIKEFPNSISAEVAYRKKLFTLLGWKELGQYGSSYGVKANFEKYMPQVLDTFIEFEKAFPNSSLLQGFRYQIAQAYWGKKDWVNTKLWLQKIIDSSKDEATFYTQAAKARLNKVEY